MNKNVVYIAVLSTALVFSLLGNGVQYSKTTELEEKIEKLSEQDEATNIAKQFVQLLMSSPSKETEEKIRAITTEKAQKEIFSAQEEHDHLEEGIKQKVIIDNTYFNRDSLDKVNVTVRYRINYQVGKKATSGNYEMKVGLVRTDNWKVDTFELEFAEKDLDPLTPSKEAGE